MEITKEIYYDKNLIQNEYFTLKYSGKLFKDNSQEVFIVYGYDEDWKYTTEQKMEKEEDCFSTKIQIKEFNKFNFCFKNSYNVWDNNNNTDYHLPIAVQENIEINEELNNLLDTILDEVKSPKKDIVSEKENDSEAVSYFENLFEELFEKTSSTESIVQDTNTEFDQLLNELFDDENTSQQLNTNLDLAETFPTEFNESTTTSINNKTETKSEQTLSLITTDHKRKSIFDFENLSPFYVLKKRIRLAFYKLIYVLPGFLFGEEED